VCRNGETQARCVERLAQSVAVNAVSAPGRSSLKDFLSTASIDAELPSGGDPGNTVSLEYGFFGRNKPLRLQVALEKPEVSAAVNHIAGNPTSSLSLTDDVTAALTFSLVTRRFGRSIAPHRALFQDLPPDIEGAAHDLGVLLNNQPQLYFSASYHLRRDIVGPREIGALVGWEYSRASLNDFLDREGRNCEPNCTTALVRFAKRISGADRAPRISISAEFKRTQPSIPELPPEQALSLFMTTKQEGFLYAVRYGAGRERRFDLGLTYDSRPDPRSNLRTTSALRVVPPSRERFTATATLTQRISERFSMPISLVWSERSEWLPGPCRYTAASPDIGPFCEPVVHKNKGRTSFQVGIIYKFPPSGRPSPCEDCTPSETSLTINKTIAGAPAGFSATVHFDVTCSSGAALQHRNASIKWPDRSVVVITAVSAGSRCRVSEESPLPPAPAGYEWVGVPIVDPPGGTLTITTGAANQVSFRNELRHCEQRGRITISKRVDGAPAGFSGTFHFNVVCWSGATLIIRQALIVIPGSSSIVVDDLPRDSLCTVTESEPLPSLPSGWIWLAPAYQPPSADVDLRENAYPEVLVIDRAKFCCASGFP
jgi:hypothetical protein